LPFDLRFGVYVHATTTTDKDFNSTYVPCESPPLASRSLLAIIANHPIQSTLSAVWGDKDYLIAPSILLADFARLGEEVDNVLEAGADVVHFDVMDNHYVPNLTIGLMVCKALRDHGVTAPIDVHLMVSPVDASYIIFHPEATNHA